MSAPDEIDFFLFVSWMHQPFYFLVAARLLPHIALGLWVHGRTSSTFEDLGEMFGVLDNTVDAPLGRCVGVSAELSK